MWSEEKINEMLTTPSEELIRDISKIKGDIMILGASGKMGPSLCVLAKNALKKAGISKRVIAVATFSDLNAQKYLEANGVEVIKCNLIDRNELNALPDAENIVYMVGKKFGTYGNEWQTWEINSMLPAYVVQKYQKSNIVVFSSGNIYPLVDVNTAGCTEETPTAPIGEYTMSCLARERTFEVAAHRFGTKVLIYRLNYAVDLRYGVLYDIAAKVKDGTPISVETPCFNVIWQGSANEFAIRGLLHATSDVCFMNVTGPEIVSVRETAEKFGELFGKKPLFKGVERSNAYLSDASKMISVLGSPSVSADMLIKWQAEWMLQGCRVLNKPTHFEERSGKY